jgi:hypothetical protein
VFINDIASAQETAPAAPPPAQAPQPNSPLGTPGPYHKGEKGDYALDPNATPMGRGGPGRPPAGMIAPTCSAATPQPPHAHINGGEAPGHFYRFEFVRVDGDQIKTKWQQWYPAKP